MWKYKSAYNSHQYLYMKLIRKSVTIKISCIRGKNHQSKNRESIFPPPKNKQKYVWEMFRIFSRSMEHKLETWFTYHFSEYEYQAWRMTRWSYRSIATLIVYIDPNLWQNLPRLVYYSSISSSIIMVSLKLQTIALVEKWFWPGMTHTHSAYTLFSPHFIHFVFKKVD